MQGEKAKGSAGSCAQRGVPDSDRRASQTVKCQSRRGPSPRWNVGVVGSGGRRAGVEVSVWVVSSRPRSICLALGRLPPSPQPRGRRFSCRGRGRRMSIGRLCLGRPLFARGTPLLLPAFCFSVFLGFVSSWSRGFAGAHGAVLQCTVFCMRRIPSRLVFFFLDPSGWYGGLRTVLLQPRGLLARKSASTKCRCWGRCRNGRKGKNVAVSGSGGIFEPRSQEVRSLLALHGHRWDGWDGQAGIPRGSRMKGRFLPGICLAGRGVSAPDLGGK